MRPRLELDEVWRLRADGQVHGGLGSAVAEVLSQTCPVPIEYVAVMDSFGESGEPDQLMEKYGLKSGDIIKAVKKVLERK